MKDLRKAEFIKMLETAKVLFEERESLIMCDIPTLGSVTYYPKADKVQINRNNTWEEGGYEFVKNILGNPTKVIVQEATSLVKIKEVKSREELRDDFAIAAMQKPFSYKPASLYQWIKWFFGYSYISNTVNYEEIASQSYKLADAMLKQREL